MLERMTKDIVWKDANESSGLNKDVLNDWAFKIPTVLSTLYRELVAQKFVESDPAANIANLRVGPAGENRPNYAEAYRGSSIPTEK